MTALGFAVEVIPTFAPSGMLKMERRLELVNCGSFSSRSVLMHLGKGFLIHIRISFLHKSYSSIVTATSSCRSENFEILMLLVNRIP